MSSLWYLVVCAASKAHIRFLVSAGAPWTTISYECDKWAMLAADLAPAAEEDGGRAMLGLVAVVMSTPHRGTLH